MKNRAVELTGHEGCGAGPLWADPPPHDRGYRRDDQRVLQRPAPAQSRDKMERYQAVEDGPAGCVYPTIIFGGGHPAVVLRRK